MGPFTKPDIHFEKLIARVTHAIGPRDSWSQQYLRNNGIVSTARFIDWSVFEEVPKEFEKSFRERARSTVCLRDDLAGLNGFNHCTPEALAKATKTILRVFGKSTGSKVCIVHQVDSDKVCADTLGKFLEELCPEVIPEQLDWMAARELYSETALIISNRLHGLLIAMRFGALPIALIDRERQPKIVGIFKDANLEELIFDIATFDPEKWEAKVREINKSRENYRIRVREYFENERSYAIDYLRSIFESSAYDHKS